MKQEQRVDTMMEMLVANPLRMLSVNLMVAATTSPPIDCNMMMVRTGGYILSSNLLVVLSIDRYSLFSD